MKMKLRDEKGKEEKKNPPKIWLAPNLWLGSSVVLYKGSVCKYSFMRATKHDQKELISKHTVVPFISSLREIASLECKTA